MSKLTFWPSFRVRMPAASTAETCTNTSLPPPSGEMKPKPLAALKNFTVPMVMIVPLIIGFRSGEMPERPWKQEHLNGRKFFGSSGAPHTKVREGQKDRSASSDLGRKNHVEACIGFCGL